jgi:lipopolysaccharide transport protein LptA
MSAIIAAMLLLVCSRGETGAAAAQGSADGRPTVLTSVRPTQKPQATVVTSDRADLDYDTNTAVFKDNVHVRDRSGDMWADTMVVHFDRNTREIKELISTGKKVIIDAHGKRSQSRKAVYTARDGKIVLTGAPSITEGRNMYAAETITIFKDSEKTIFEPKARLILYSDKQFGEAGELP